MDIDFSSLAARIAADMQDLRGCVIVSRDGLVLGSHPADAESILRPAWLRFASLGDVEKGFLQFAGELWVYVRKGPYASFAVSNSVSRPGLLLDELEHVLATAEEARNLDQGISVSGSSSGVSAPGAGSSGAGLPGGRPRTSLHPETKPSIPASAPSRAESVASDEGFAELSAMAQLGESAEEATEDTTVVVGDASSAPTTTPQATPEATPSVPLAPARDMYAQYAPAKEAGSPAGPEQVGSSGQGESSGEVDRVALAQEFAQLLGDSGYDESEGD